MLLVLLLLLRVSATFAFAFAFTTPSVSSPVRMGWSSSSSFLHGPHSIVLVSSSSDNTKNSQDDEQQQSDTATQVTSKSSTEEEETSVVPVGSKSYYKGFLASPVVDNTVAERGAGIEQAVKLGGVVTVSLGILVVGFMASNGLL